MTTDASTGTAHAVAAPENRGATAPSSGAGTAVRVELLKLASQLQLRIALVLCAVVPIAAAVALRMASTRPSDTLFGRWAGTTGFATSLLLLNWAVAWGVPLLAGLFAGDVFANEDRHGTWKTILTRSCARSRIFLGKATAAALCVWTGFCVMAVSSIAASLAIVGSSPLVGLSGQLIESGRALGLVAASWALSLLWTSVFVAFGLLLSVASRSGVVGVLGPLVAAIVLQLLQSVASNQVVRDLLPTTPSDAWHALFTAPVPAGPIVQAMITSIVYTGLLSGAAWRLLRRRDVVAAEVSGASWAHRPRVVVGTSIAVAVGCGVLGGFGTTGPTALTAHRLEDSVATTFGHLAEVRYQWESGAQADTTIPWHAACNRGADTRRTVGAGDDWSCTLTDLRPADGVASSVLDVTLDAKGCYQVQSPPGAVGPLYVDDAAGAPFINPLYAFDGCLGTP